MSEHPRTLLDDLDTAFVGEAPVAHLFSGGRAATRRKRRALVAGGAVAMALAVGGGSLALQGIPGSTEGRDTTPVVADPAASDLRVLVDMDVPKPLSTLLDGQEGKVAIWNPAERTLEFVPDTDYSSSCPPLATAQSTASEAVTLIVRGDPDTGPCTMDARHVTISITGLTTAPPDLTVTVSGETHTIPVESATGEPTQSASRRIEMPVGHCWIDPVRFGGTKGRGATGPVRPGGRA